MRWEGAKQRILPDSLKYINWQPGSPDPNRLLIVHVMQGTLWGTDAWFRNPRAGASANFGIGNDGTCFQWVDTDAMSYNACDANPVSIGVETEGYSGQPFTNAQIDKLARLFHWANRNYPDIDMWLNTNPVRGSGLSWHGLGGDSWCGHPSCPGSPRVKQLGQILTRAKAL